MRATVIGLTVASLIAVGPASAQETARAAASAAQDSARELTSTPGAADTIRFGGRVIAAGDTVTGPVLVAAGDLRVRGTITGTAVHTGDIVVGRVDHQDAIAVLGGQREGGVIGGTAVVPVRRSFRRPTNSPRPGAASNALSLVGWLVVMR